MYMVHKILSHNDGSDAVQKMQKKQLKNRFIKPPKPIGSFFLCERIEPRRHFPGGGGTTWVFFGWVCAARDSKLAPRSKKNSPKIDTPF